MRADPASFPLCRVSGRAVGRVRPRPPARSPRRRARRTGAFRGKQREPGRAGRGGPSAGLDKGGRDPCSPRRDVDPGPHHRRLPDAHHRGRFPQSHHRGAARAGVGAVRRAARVPAPVLPGQAGEEPRGRGRGSGRAAGGAQDAGPRACGFALGGTEGRGAGPGKPCCPRKGDSGHGRSVRGSWVPLFPRLGGGGDRSREGQRAWWRSCACPQEGRAGIIGNAGLFRSPAPGSQMRDEK